MTAKRRGDPAYPEEALEASTERFRKRKEGHMSGRAHGTLLRLGLAMLSLIALPALLNAGAPAPDIDA